MESTTVPATPSRRLSADERRAQILREAAQLFGSHGFNGTTTRDVAAQVGITEAALYRYFRARKRCTPRSSTSGCVAALLEPVEPIAAAGDDRAVFTMLALTLLRSVEADPRSCA